MSGESEGTELLYETPESGLLQINGQGKAYRDSGAQDYDGPSLSGVQPAYGRSATQKGLGGSLVSASTDDPAQDPHDVRAPVRAVMAEPRKEVPLTPEQMMAMANQMENEMYAEHRARMAQGPAVRYVHGGTPESDFNTELTGGAEQAYQNWSEKGTDDGRDYDYRGAFADDIRRTTNGHLPDTYKKPNHETFSDESKYAEHGNPGHWDGEKFTPGKQLPEWLQKYMSAQPEYIGGPSGVTVVDKVGGHKYLSEHERLRKLRDEHRAAGLK